MDENQDKPEEQIAEDSQVVDDKQTELREIAEEELKKILDDHQKYLESAGKDGKIAILSFANLSGVNLSGADLSKANLSWTDFSGANLSKADLSEANLGWANLNKADLSKANLSWAYLIGANLSEADFSRANISKANLVGTNLSGANLSQADLSKAVLEVAEFSGTNFRNANFSGANLSRANLNGENLAEENLGGAALKNANLVGANLSGANLSWTNLSGANLREANFVRADLSGASLNRARLFEVHLSGAIVNESTLFFTKMVKGGQIGVNGIWSKHSDSAALMTVTPPGDSMQGPNPDAVIESLKRARRLHGFSMSLVGIIILIAILNLTEIKFPWAGNVKVTPSQFGLLAMPMSIGLLILVGSFMSDALKGARYLQDRTSAMSVGNFPWSLSNYSSHERTPKYLYFRKNKVAQFLSFITRMVMSFHPITYIFILGLWQVFNPIVFYILSIITLALSGWILFISEQFQRPILFDRKTEEEKKNDIEKLTDAVEKQTEKLDKLVEIFKPKED